VLVPTGLGRATPRFPDLWPIGTPIPVLGRVEKSRRRDPLFPDSGRLGIGKRGAFSTKPGIAGNGNPRLWRELRGPQGPHKGTVAARSVARLPQS
jgi:hypothetical protein